MNQRTGILGPLILVMIGLLLLLNNLGMLPLGLWGTVWRFWPVVLILIGLNVLATHSDSQSRYILFVLLGIVTVIGVTAIAYSWPVWHQTEDLNDKDLSIADHHGMFRVFVDLSDANFSGARMEDSRLIFVDMNRANLEGADLEGAIMVFVDLSDANLKNMDVRGAKFIFVEMGNAELEGTDIQTADLIFTAGN